MNGRQLEISVPARLDVRSQASVLARSGSRIARRFVTNLEATYREIVDQPGLGSPWDLADETTANLRCRPVKKFPHHLVFYYEMDESVVIARVLHSSQDIQSELQINLGPD